MTKRIMLPVEDEKGLEAKVAHHFGMAPYFAIVEINENKTLKVKTEPNKSEHHGGPAGHSPKLPCPKTRRCSSIFNGARGTEHIQRCWNTSSRG